MVNEEILGGLKLALSKGESLKQAMMSFYNAGYKKEEIEEAARASQGQKIEKEPIQPVQQAKLKKQKPVQKIPQPKPSKTIQRVSSYEQEPYSPKIRKGLRGAIKELEKIDVSLKVKPKVITKKLIKTPQKVSTYEEKPKPKGKLITLLLVFFLLFLFGILAAIFFFRQEIVEFLNNLFS
ncbi:hypothetical protein ES703_92277 [subsurface metagenome]